MCNHHRLSIYLGCSLVPSVKKMPMEILTDELLLLNNDANSSLAVSYFSWESCLTLAKVGGLFPVSMLCFTLEFRDI